MNVKIMTPLTIAVDEDEVLALRTQDASGSFGILPRHADFLTSLTVSVVSWRKADGIPHYCAVRGGILTVTAGNDVDIATREAIPGDNLATLDQTILSRFHADIDAERTEHAENAKLQLSAIRQMMLHLRPAAGSGPGEFE